MEKLLCDDEHVNNSEFLCHFRVSRESFSRNLSLIKNNAVFKSTGNAVFRGSAELHLHVLLKFLGGFGNGNNPLSPALFSTILSGRRI